MLAPADLDYPVLCLSHDTSVAVAHAAEDLCRCTALAFWRNQYFRDLQLLDAGGAPYTVAEASTERPFSPMRRTLARLLNQHLRVKLDVRPQGLPSLVSAKERVGEWLDRDPEFWESARALTTWKRQITGCVDMRALIALFE